MSVTTVQHHVMPMSANTNRTGSIAKHAVIGGAVGAVAGVGLSFIGPLPIIGGMFAPIAAAIGGAAGLVVGGLVGFLRTRGSGGSEGVRVGTNTLQTAPPLPSNTSGAVPQLPPPLPR